MDGTIPHSQMYWWSLKKFGGFSRNTMKWKHWWLLIWPFKVWPTNLSVYNIMVIGTCTHVFWLGQMHIICLSHITHKPTVLSSYQLLWCISSTTQTLNYSPPSLSFSVLSCSLILSLVNSFFSLATSCSVRCIFPSASLSLLLSQRSWVRFMSSSLITELWSPLDFNIHVHTLLYSNYMHACILVYNKNSWSRTCVHV